MTKIIQLCPGPGNPASRVTLFYALCDDGSIWRLSRIADWGVTKGGFSWELMPLIDEKGSGPGADHGSVDA